MKFKNILNTITLGDCYTSKQYHTNIGLGYAVCEECHIKECEKEKMGNSVKVENNYISKDKIIAKIKELQIRSEKNFEELDRLQNIVVMSLEEYKKLIELRNEYFDLQIKIETLQELLEEEENDESD